MAIPKTLLVLIILGFVAALLALIGRYFKLPAFLTGPLVCQLKEGGCIELFRSPRAVIMGIPMSFFACLFYPILAYGWVYNWPKWLMVAGASVCLMMSVKMGIGLIKRKLQCRICWAGHIINLMIWVQVIVK